MHPHTYAIAMNALVTNTSVYIKVKIALKKRHRRPVKDNYNNSNLKYIMDEL